MIEIIIVGVMIPIVITIIGITYNDEIKRFFKRNLTNTKRVQVNSFEEADLSHFTFGGRTTSFVVCDGDGEQVIKPGNIKTTLLDRPRDLPEELNQIRNQIKEREESKKQQQKKHMYTTSQVALVDYVINKTDIHEEIELNMQFAPNDYFTFQATVGSMNEVLEGESTVQEKYVKKIADLKAPVDYLANGVGVVLTVLTKDNKIVLTKRREDTGIRQGEYDTSIVEGIDSIKDKAGSGRGPDIYQAAVRAANEELKLHVTHDQIKIFGFGVDDEYYQWNFIGMVTTEKTAQQVLEDISSGVHSTNELKNLIFIDHRPEAGVEILKTQKLWSTAQIALYWTLVNLWGTSMVNKEIQRAFKEELVST